MKIKLKLFFLLGIFSLIFHNVSAQEYKIQTSKAQNLNAYINRYLAKYDFNKDGLDDLLVGGDNWQTTDKTKILLLINKGDGSFVDSTSSYITGSLVSNDPVATSADFNNDGVLDIAIFDAGNQELGQDPTLGGYRGEEAILLLSQQGKRKWVVSDVLAEAVSKVTNYSTSRKLHLKYATNGDINNDGLIDILVETGGGYKQPLTHFYINQGNGNFIADTYRIPQKVLEGPVGQWRYSKNMLVDVNNDGFKDVVLGQLRRKDNKQDDLNSIVLINDKTGNFSASNMITLPRADFNKTWNYVRGILSKDLNNDGFQDLIFSLCRSGSSDSKYPMSGTSFQVLINSGGKEFIDKTRLFIQNDDNLEAEVNSIYAADNKNEPKDLLFVDMNKDGYDDIFLAQSWDPASKFMPIIMLNNGKNYFVPFNSDHINQGQKYIASLAYPIDVNKDKDLDIVSLSTKPGKDNTYGTADDVMDLMPLFGKVTINPINTISFFKSSLSLGPNKENQQTPMYKIGSFGFLGTKIYEQHEPFYYPSFSDYNQAGWFGLDPHNMAVGDFNGDGKKDVVFTWAIFPHTLERNVRASFSVLLNNGDGSLRYAPEMIENDSLLKRFFAYRTAVVDFNMDGKSDIVAASMGLIKRNPEGTYTTKFEPIPLALSTPKGTLKNASDQIEGQENGGLPTDFSFGHDLSAGDVNGDGFPDIYTGKLLLTNDGKGNFKNSSNLLPREMRPFDFYIMSSAIGDLNKDGIGDIVGMYSDGGPSNPKSGFILLSKGGDKSMSNRTLIPLPEGKFGAGVTKFNYTIIYDIDGNGFPDLVVAVTKADPYYEGRNLQVFMNYGDGKFVDETSSRIKSKAYLDTAHGEGSLYIADANGDGVNDIVHSSADWGTTHGATIYINNKGILEVMDDSEFAWLQSWQIDGFEKTRNPNTSITNKSNKMYPVDLDGKNGVDFISSISKPSLVYPPIEPKELVFYSILSLNPNGDDDADGVINRYDLCASTLKGAKIDSKGCDLILGNSLADKKVIISPNPFEQSIKIEFPEDFGPMVSAKIHDVKGVVVWEKESVRESEIVDLSSLSVGNYVLNLTSQTNGQVSVVKISKQGR